DAAGFGQAWYGLLTINVLLWEAQETLYGADLDRADGETLRDYITWFSWGNVRRNAFIALCERLYWQEARA
ncbi:MAG: hypothetical protein K2Q10_04415, partial [Rhodospirillales bacterium]|nr:hypothetical protein [Rhodospirillales bacterium]